MATIDLTSIQLNSIGKYMEMRNFLMYMRKGWHIRLDQKLIGTSLKHLFRNAKGEETGTYGYRISSFHIKQDNNYSFIGANEASDYFGKKINAEESDYVYFAYMGSGVWQPIWGYGKYEEKHKGKSVWKPDRNQMSTEAWSFACNKARWFLAELSKTTKEDHGLAMGPVQGEKMNLISQT